MTTLGVSILIILVISNLIRAYNDYLIKKYTQERLEEENYRKNLQLYLDLKKFENLYTNRDWGKMIFEYEGFDFSSSLGQSKYLQMLAEAYISIGDIETGEYLQTKHTFLRTINLRLNTLWKQQMHFM